jgi:hypothetical protein
MSEEEERILRQSIHDDIISLREFRGEPINSVMAVLWINKCARIALGTRND